MNKQKMIKKGVALFLVLCLIFTYSGLTAFGDTVYAPTVSTDVVNDPGFVTDDLSSGEVQASKTVTDLGDGVFEISLKAEGKDFDKVTHTVTGLDVVFVLDYSSSMGNDSGSTKFANMKAAATQAINKILSENANSPGLNRVAVVSYNTTASKRLPDSNVTGTGGWLTGSSMGTAVLPSRGTGATDYTNIMAGSNVAYQILDNRADKSRSPVIILMTDGQPNYYYTNTTNHTSPGTATRTNTSGYTNENAVYYTIRNLVDIKSNITDLQLITIGFDLDNVSSSSTNANRNTDTATNGLPVQRAFAYATINPSTDTAGKFLKCTTSANGTANSGVSSAMSSLLTRLGGDSFTNPVKSFQDSSSGLQDIINAFEAAINDIHTPTGPASNIQITDNIDPNFQVDSIGGAGVNENAYSIDQNGQLKWNIPDGAVVNAATELTFIVSLKEGAVAANMGENAVTLYTNPGYDDSANFLSFTPTPGNTFYFDEDGVAIPGHGVWANGKVVQDLGSTGIVTIGRNAVASDLTITKLADEAGATIPPGTAFSFTVKFWGAGVSQLSDYTQDAVLKNKVEKSGNTYTFTLGVDESVTFAAVPKGVHYKVTEARQPYYEVEYDNATGVIGVDDTDVTVTNKLMQSGIAVKKEVVEKTGKHTVAEVTDPTYEAGDLVVYRITISNPYDITLKHVGWNESAGFAGPYATFNAAQAGGDRGKLRHTGGYTLAPGASMTFFYTYTVSEDTELTPSKVNEVTAYGWDNEGVKQQASDTATISFKYPNLEISKSIVIKGDRGKKFKLVNEQTFASGETAFFVISVKNTGDATARNVKLAEDWDEGNIEFVTSSVQGMTDPQTESFDVAPGGTEWFVYSAQLEGKDAEALAAQYEQTKAGYTQDCEAAQAAVDAAWEALITAFEPFEEFGYSLNPGDDIDPILQEIKADEDVTVDLDELEAAIGDYYVCANALNSANDVLNAFVENGLNVDDTLTVLGNTATAVYTYGEPEDTATVIVKPQQESDLSIKKSVRVEGDNDWHSAVVLPSGGGTVEYRVVIKNSGSVIENVTLTDSLQSGEGWPKQFAIGPGGVREVTYTLAIDSNGSYYIPDFVPNTATLTDSDENEYSSCALVTVLPTPFSELLIDKKVSFDGKRWSKSLSTYSDDPVPVIYRVSLMNIGTATSNFTLTDDPFSDAVFYTDAQCENVYDGYVSENTIALRPLGVLTLYYKADLETSTDNTATFEITNNAKDGKATGSSSASVTIEPVPVVQLSVEKKVAIADEFYAAARPDRFGTLGDEKTVSSIYGEGDFIFFVKVTNKGDYPAEVQLSDVMKDSSSEAVYDFGDDFDMFDDTIALDPGQSQVFRIPVSISTDGASSISYRNTVTIDEVSAEQLSNGGNAKVIIDQESDYADITVNQTPKPNVKLTVEKQVWQDNADPTKAAWTDKAAYTADSQVVKFRVRVSGEAVDNQSLEWEVTGNIADSLKADFDGTFTISNDEPVTDWMEYSLTLTKGTHENIATAVPGEHASDFQIDEQNSKLTASATADITNGSNPPPPTPPHNTTHSTTPSNPTINEQPVPLAVMPETVIPEEDVPLADIPQTGTDDMAFSLMLLGVSLSALMMMLFGRKKSSNKG